MIVESTFEVNSLQEFGESLVDLSGALCADFADVAFFAILEALGAGNAVVDIVVLKNIIKNDGIRGIVFTRILVLPVGETDGFLPSDESKLFFGAVLDAITSSAAGNAERAAKAVPGGLFVGENRGLTNQGVGRGGSDNCKEELKSLF